ncbi:MAG: hypothetical protein ACYC66_15605 [Chloroflexota bacterium]
MSYSTRKRQVPDIEDPRPQIDFDDPLMKLIVELIVEKESEPWYRQSIPFTLGIWTTCNHFKAGKRKISEMDLQWNRHYKVLF